MFRFDFFVTALSARIFDVSNTWNICDWKLFNNKNVLKVIGREIILAILGCCFLLFWAKQEMLFKSCGINKKNCDIWPFIYDVHKKTDQTFTPLPPQSTCVQNLRIYPLFCGCWMSTLWHLPPFPHPQTHLNPKNFVPRLHSGALFY